MRKYAVLNKIICNFLRPSLCAISGENPTHRNIYKWHNAALWIFFEKHARWRSRVLDFFSGFTNKIEVRLQKILNNKWFILESVCPKTRFALWSFPVIQKRIGVADFGDSSKNDSWNSMIFWFLAPINKRSSTKWIYRKYFWKCEVMDATLSYCAKNEVLVNVTGMLQNKN